MATAEAGNPTKSAGAPPYIERKRPEHPPLVRATELPGQRSRFSSEMAYLSLPHPDMFCARPRGCRFVRYALVAAAVPQGELTDPARRGTNRAIWLKKAVPPPPTIITGTQTVTIRITPTSQQL